MTSSLGRGRGRRLDTSACSGKSRVHTGPLWGAWWFLLIATLERGSGSCRDRGAGEPLVSPDSEQGVCATVQKGRAAGVLVRSVLLTAGECGRVQEFRWFACSRAVGVYSFPLMRLPVSWPFGQRELGLRGAHSGACWRFWIFLGRLVSSSQSGGRGKRNDSGLLPSPHVCFSFPLSFGVFS